LSSFTSEVGPSRAVHRRGDLSQCQARIASRIIGTEGSHNDAVRISGGCTFDRRAHGEDAKTDQKWAFGMISQVAQGLRKYDVRNEEKPKLKTHSQ